MNSIDLNIAGLLPHVEATSARVGTMKRPNLNE